MSDYLWDKTGEADTEVERLEELLGELRHRPRALGLPPEVEADGARAPRLFRTALLAVAAALLLAIMGVAFVALRSDKTNSDRQSASQGSQQSPTRQIAPPQSQPPEVIVSPGVNPAPQPEIHDVKFTNGVPSRKGEPRRRGERVVAVKPGQEPITTAGNSPKEHESAAIETMYWGGREESSAEVAALRQLAKEQLIYALHLTNSKLKEVRKKTQGINESNSTFDRRNRIR